MSNSTDSEQKKQTNNIAAGTIVLTIAVFLILSLGFLGNKYKNSSKSSSSSSSSSQTSNVSYSSVYDFISNNSSYSIVKTAVDKAGLSENLKKGPITVFLPDNDAFNKLPENLKNDLLYNSESTKTLQTILLYHVPKDTAGNSTNGLLKFADLEKIANSKSDQLDTLSGEKVNVVIQGDAIYINGSKIVAADQVVGDSIIQTIDTVLVPSDDTLLTLNPSTNSIIRQIVIESKATSFVGTFKGSSNLLSKLAAFPDTTMTVNKDSVLTLEAKGFNLGVFNNEALKVNGAYPDVTVTAVASVNNLSSYAQANLVNISITQLNLVFSVNGTQLPVAASKQILQGLQSVGLTLPTLITTASPINSQLILTKDSDSITLTSRPEENLVIQFTGKKV